MKYRQSVFVSCEDESLFIDLLVGRFMHFYESNEKFGLVSFETTFNIFSMLG